MLLRMHSLIVLFLLSIGAVAAQNVSIEEAYRDMPKGEAKYAFFMRLPDGTDEDLFYDTWKDFCKDRFNAKPKEQSKRFYLSDDAEMETISNNTVDLYSQYLKTGKITNLVVWFNLGGAYLNPKQHADKVAAARQILTDYHERLQQKLLEIQLEKEAEILDDLTDELDDMADEESDLEKEIRKAEETIEKARAELEEVRKKKVRLQEQVKDQEKAMKKLKKQ